MALFFMRIILLIFFVIVFGICGVVIFIFTKDKFINNHKVNKSQVEFLENNPNRPIPPASDSATVGTKKK